MEKCKCNTCRACLATCRCNKVIGFRSSRDPNIVDYSQLLTVNDPKNKYMVDGFYTGITLYGNLPKIDSLYFYSKEYRNYKIDERVKARQNCVCIICKNELLEIVQVNQILNILYYSTNAFKDIKDYLLKNLDDCKLAEDIPYKGNLNV